MSVSQVLRPNTTSNLLEVSRTSEHETIDKQKDVNLNHESSSSDLTKTELANVSQSCIATCNTELSFNIDNPSDFQNIRTTPTTSSSFNRSHAKLMQILDTEHRNVFQPPRQRSKPLNLSASKKQRTNNKGDYMKENAKKDKLSNNMAKKSKSNLN
jgi:hypothetical protein